MDRLEFAGKAIKSLRRKGSLLYEPRRRTCGEMLIWGLGKGAL